MFCITINAIDRLYIIINNIIIIIDRFYIALFSALGQTHCARMRFYMSEWLFIARFLNISTEDIRHNNKDMTS